MSTLAIGKNGFTLPLDLVTSTQAILARKRSGKSYTASVEAEELLEQGQQIVVIDPTSAWHGLRSSADGQGPGYPIVVFGGDHEDAPLEYRAGKSMAAAVIEHGFSAIFDVGNLHTEEQVQFVMDFCSELLRVNRQALHVFMDEADTFAPQKPLGLLQNKCLGTVSRLVKQGGIKGVGFTMITQRPASMNKDVLSQVDILTVLRMSHPLDIKAATDWIKSEVGVEFAATVEVALPRLPVGTAFFCSASLGFGERVDVRARRTFNSGATPKPGERKAEPTVLAKVDIERLGKEISASVQRVREASPEFLRQRVAELETELAKGGNVGILEDVQRMEAELKELRPLRERAEKATFALKTFLADLRTVVEATESALGDDIVERIPTRDEILARPLHLLPEQEMELMQTAPLKEKVVYRDNPTDTSLSGPACKILAALSQFRAIGIHAPDRMHVCLFSGYSNSSSTGFAKALSGLSTAGMVTYPAGGKVALTSSGIAAAPQGQPIRGSEDLQARIMGMLTGPEQRIFAHVLRFHPRPVEREALMRAAGYTNEASTGFAKALSHLSSMGFVSYPAPKKVAATNLCFINGAARA